MFLFARVGIPHAGCQGHAYTKQMKVEQQVCTCRPPDYRIPVRISVLPVIDKRNQLQALDIQKIREGRVSYANGNGVITGKSE